MRCAFPAFLAQSVRNLSSEFAAFIIGKRVATTKARIRIHCSSEPAGSRVFHNIGGLLRDILRKLARYHMKREINSGAKTTRSFNTRLLHEARPTSQIYFREIFRETIVGQLICCHRSHTDQFRLASAGRDKS